MKNPLPFTTVCAAFLAVALLSAAAEPTGTKPTTKSNKATTSLADEPEIPLSVFVMPKGPPDGRDPFFPNSPRPYQQAPKPRMVTPTNAAPVALTVTGGTPPNLIMIEGRAFNKGEEGDVKTPAGKRRIRVLEIHSDLSAVIEFVPEGDRQEVRMRREL